MSDNEAYLRDRQLNNQANRPPTYPVTHIKGKFEFKSDENFEFILNVPLEQLDQIPIPDGMRTQADMVKYLVTTGAITFLGHKALNGAGDTNKVINNNAPAAGGTP
jgi:hypothetical protein